MGVLSCKHMQRQKQRERERQSGRSRARDFSQLACACRVLAALLRAPESDWPRTNIMFNVPRWCEPLTDLKNVNLIHLYRYLHAGGRESIIQHCICGLLRLLYLRKQAQKTDCKKMLSDDVQFMLPVVPSKVILAMRHQCIQLLGHPNNAQ